MEWLIAVIFFVAGGALSWRFTLWSVRRLDHSAEELKSGQAEIKDLVRGILTDPKFLKGQYGPEQLAATAASTGSIDILNRDFKEELGPHKEFFQWYVTKAPQEDDLESCPKCGRLMTKQTTQVSTGGQETTYRCINPECMWSRTVYDRHEG
jgi:hypothetical protein